MGNEVFTKELLVPARLVAVTTYLGVVCGHAIADSEVLDLTAKCSHDACALSHDQAPEETRPCPVYFDKAQLLNLPGGTFSTTLNFRGLLCCVCWLR